MHNLLCFWTLEMGKLSLINLTKHIARYQRYLNPFKLKIWLQIGRLFSPYKNNTLWCQLEDMLQLIVMPQGIEKVTIQLIDTPTKVYAIGARLFFIKGAPKSSKLGIDPINSQASYFGKSTGSNKRSVLINCVF